jgi:hypothetical protein
MTEQPNRPDLGGMRILLDSALLGGMKDPDTHTFVYFHAPDLLAYAERLEKEVERLRGRREEAFREGYQTGRTDGMQDENSEDWRWRGSDARAALNPEVNP